MKSYIMIYRQWHMIRLQNPRTYTLSIIWYAYRIPVHIHCLYIMIWDFISYSSNRQAFVNIAMRHSHVSHLKCTDFGDFLDVHFKSPLKYVDFLLSNHASAFVFVSTTHIQNIQTDGGSFLARALRARNTFISYNTPNPKANEGGETRSTPPLLYVDLYVCTQTIG